MSEFETQALNSLNAQTYRFGFILSTAMGNKTRYLNFRKYAERDSQIETVWAPIQHFIPPGEPNPFRYLPTPLHDRAVVLSQAAPVLKQMNRLDAVMIHLFEAYTLSCVRSLAHQSPLIVWNHDDPPMVDSDTHSIYSQYSHHANKRSWRRRVRLEIDRWCTSRTALFVPWSAWSANILVKACGVPQEKILPLHVGIDLEQWTYASKPDDVAVPKILFVGGDFIRKGGDLLLKVFTQQFSERAELHLVTKTPPSELAPNVYVYTDLSPKDDRLFQLFSQADLFVLPTLGDLSSFASLEAMASGCAVISTDVGGIRDIVRQGDTGLLVPTGDEIALADAMKTLLDNPSLRRTMGAAGRSVVEREFNSAINVPCILNAMKTSVDAQRADPKTHSIANRSTALTSFSSRNS